jgi:RNA polymerase sigma-70 factor (ECF subfamily)
VASLVAASPAVVGAWAPGEASPLSSPHPASAIVASPIASAAAIRLDADIGSPLAAETNVVVTYGRTGRSDGAIWERVVAVQSIVVWLRADDLSDEALLTAVGVGDEEAATVFVRRFQRRVFGLALTITLDQALADDVAQQAFTNAWRNAGSYDARRGAVSTWLLAVTRNVAIDTMRVRRPQPIDDVLLAELLPASAQADPSDHAATHDLVARVGQALDRLPTEQRRAVLLATIGSRTSVEIAELEGVPVPTAKHRVQSGLRKLRRALPSVVER